MFAAEIFRPWWPSPEGDPAVIEERFRSLQRQVPLLYLIALANIVGLHLVTLDLFRSLVHPANLLILVVLVRLWQWRSKRHLVLPLETIVRELRMTLLLAGALSLMFAGWAIVLFNEGDAQQQVHVVLFASLAALGCAYALSPFPAAARLPLLFAALPIALRLVASQQPAHVAMGISLAMVTLLILRLLEIHSAGNIQLVRSRTQITLERERARAAEAAARTEQAKTRIMAETDALTGLMNRRAFLDLMSGLDDVAGDHAVALIDLDGFKPINDTFGHATGDRVLVEVAHRLLDKVRDGGFVARMGGDEFAMLVPCADRPDRGTLARSFCRALHSPIRVGVRQFRVSASCGLTMVGTPPRSPAQILSEADVALYRAKQLGRGRAAIFSTEIEAAARRRSTIEATLRESEAQETISHVYQPIFQIRTGRLTGFEALARWTHPLFGEVGPSEFIQIAEQANVIEEISERLLRKALVDAKAWPPGLALSFNLSAAAICSLDAAERVMRILDETGTDPTRLQIEVTETTMLTDFDSARRNLAALRASGVRIVLDDFGSGFASISYLREINFDGVKLDGSLIAAALAGGSRLKLLTGVLGLCEAMDVSCVAEHIESQDQLDMLAGLGCQYGQGYHLSRPLSAADALAQANGLCRAARARSDRKRAA